MKIDKYAIVAELEKKLKERGVPFVDGFPTVPQNMFVRDIPDEILPFPNHLKATNPARALLTNFSNDEILYTSFARIDERLEIAKNFLGMTGFDFSAREGDDEVNQDFYLYLNKLLDAYFASCGIRILPNFRITGELSSLKVFHIYPPKTWFAVGTLGCANGHIAENETLLRYKLIFSRPGYLLVYGVLKDEYRKILVSNETPYTVFEDYARRSRGGKI